ncbi:MAG TPA: hypothetical protein PLA79_01460 [Bacteroidales bacterium]|nr:hypothetical protein [Bacteroidales bacterium]
MTKIKRNPNKARSRKRKVKKRVHYLRNRIKRDLRSIPLSESDKLSNRINAEAFMMAHVNDDDIMPKELKEEFKVRFRYDLLFDMRTIEELL